MIRPAITSFFLFLIFSAISQGVLPSVKVLTSGTKTSLRGLSVVSNEIIWVSGNHGTVGRSTNGGRDWKWMIIKNFENNDFRDIEAFDASTAIIISVAEPAYILKTIDAGQSWKVVYENKTKGIFLDALEFWNDQAGIVLGDPINGKFFIGRTFDGGNTWKEVPRNYLPAADSGEACFAASGTNIRALNNAEAVFVSGGLVSSVFIRDAKVYLPVLQGKETTGANSIAVYNRLSRKGGNKLVVVGGDFNKDTASNNNCVYSRDRGKTWSSPATAPHGYRSCVEYLSKTDLVACGLTGVDYSADDAVNWQLISPESFNVCRMAKTGNAVFLAGNNGKIATLVFNKK